jgi:hypothetical protein
MDGQILSVVILFGAEAVTKSRGPTQAAKARTRGYRTTQKFVKNGRPHRRTADVSARTNREEVQFGST